jgi:hypothetical protein
MAIDTVYPVIAADFRTPDTMIRYERFLQRLVLVDSEDRFKALDIRQKDGVEGAIKFLDTCALEGRKSAPRVFDAGMAQLHIETALQLVSVCSHAVEGLNTEGSDDIRLTLSNEVWTELRDAVAAIGAGIDDNGNYRAHAEFDGSAS